MRVTIAQSHMAETALSQGPVLEVVSPDGSRRPVPVTQTPFGIGRGSEAENHLKLDDPLISRQCAAIVARAQRRSRDTGHGGA